MIKHFGMSVVIAGLLSTGLMFLSVLKDDQVFYVFVGIVLAVQLHRIFLNKLTKTKPTKTSAKGIFH